VPLSGQRRPNLFEGFDFTATILPESTLLRNGTKLADRTYQSNPMKSSNTFSHLDQNWHWPEKTWFRERLSAIKAREHEQRRKPIVANQPSSDQTSASDSANKDQLKAD
jgi:hypothetical protein